MNVLDIICLVVFLLAVVIATAKGLVSCIISFIAPVLSAWCAFMFYSKIAVLIEPKVNIHWLAVGLGFLAVFSAVFIVLMIIKLILKKIFSNNILGSLNRFLGFVFGVISGMALVCIILIAVNVQTFVNLDSIIESSFFLNLFLPVINSCVDSINSTKTALLVSESGLV